MEFLVGTDGAIIPDPEIAAKAEQLANTQAAFDLFRVNAERVKYFKQRATELGRSGRDIVITLIDVDDPAGSILADCLMPEYDWQRFRDAGEKPVARGLASKDGVAQFLEGAGYNIASKELMDTDKLMVVVLEADTALVLDVDFDRQSY